MADFMQFENNHKEEQYISNNQDDTMDNAIGIDRSMASMEEVSFIHGTSMCQSRSPGVKSSGSSAQDIICSTNVVPERGIPQIKIGCASLCPIPL